MQSECINVLSAPGSELLIYVYVWFLENFRVLNQLQICYNRYACGKCAVYGSFRGLMSKSKDRRKICQNREVITLIEMQDVWKTYPNGTHALQGISVKIDRNEFVYVVGPSGAGKSTFMKLIYREETPTKGQISVGGFNIGKLKPRKIPYVRRNIGVVFQDFRLLPKLTAYENVAFAMEVIEAPKKIIKKRVNEVLDLVGLRSKANREPSQLSGGEQQRIAIARAIVNNPAVIIADEPTGNLDPETSWGIMQLLDEINFRGTTIVMATHNRDIVNKMRKRVLAIENGNIVRDQVRGDYGYEF